ncbi:UNVERIFIED_ORG: hypothetical protein ABID33_001449 [Xanthobacter viscosus]
MGTLSGFPYGMGAAVAPGLPMAAPVAVASPAVANPAGGVSR